MNLPSGLTWNAWPASPEAGVYFQEDNNDVLPGNGHRYNSSGNGRKGKDRDKLSEFNHHFGGESLTVDESSNLGV